MHLPPVVTCTEVLQKPFNAKSTSVTPELIYRHPPPKKIWLHTRKIHHHKHHPHARKSHHEAVSLSSFPARENNNYI